MGKGLPREVSRSRVLAEEMPHPSTHFPSPASSWVLGWCWELSGPVSALWGQKSGTDSGGATERELRPGGQAVGSSEAQWSSPALCEGPLLPHPPPT